MAFKTVTDLSADNTVALGGTNRKTGKTNPTSAEGYYLGSREVDSQKSKTGKAKIHVFQTPKGNLGVWGKTDLDRKMESVVLGAMTRITYTGMQETKNNPMYKYKVEVDDTNTIEVSSLSAGSENTELDNGGYSEAETEEYGNNGEETETEVDQEVLDAAARLVAERKAKVQSLLGGGAKKTK